MSITPAWPAEGNGWVPQLEWMDTVDDLAAEAGTCEAPPRSDAERESGPDVLAPSAQGALEGIPWSD